MLFSGAGGKRQSSKIYLDVLASGGTRKHESQRAG